MSNILGRLLFLAPAVTFGMGAAFVASSFALGIAPENPATWQAFMTLAPLTREPVNLIDSIPGVGYRLTFMLFAAITLGSLAMAFTSWGSERMRWGAAHLALVTILYSMGHVSKSYSSISMAEPVSFFGRFSRVLNYSTPSQELLALLVLVGAACLVTHAAFIGRIASQYKSRMTINRQVGALIGEFRN